MLRDPIFHFHDRQEELVMTSSACPSRCVPGVPVILFHDHLEIRLGSLKMELLLYHYIPLISRVITPIIGVIAPVTHVIRPLMGVITSSGQPWNPATFPIVAEAVVGFQIGDGSLCGTGPVAQIGRLTSQKKAFPGCQRWLYMNFIAFSECRCFFDLYIYI